ncbi:MAG: alpha/beta hydrolase family protein [Alphaproteobacteria bacterium]
MSCQYLERPGKPSLAYHYTPPNDTGSDLPVIMFLGGFKSDMQGSKATFLEEQCKARGQGYVRFDYSGHGQSGGEFAHGTIGAWKQDAMDMFEHIDPHSCLIIGSSMGGWLALHLAIEYRARIKAMIGIAAAPDFTQDLWYNRLNDQQRQIVEKEGYVEMPNQYSEEPYIFTKALFEDGRAHFLMDKDQSLDIPITLLQGMADPDVPWETTTRIQNAFPRADVDIVLIEDGDHSLSRPEDLDVLNREIMALIGRNETDNSL